MTVLLTDDFNDASIDTSKWVATGNVSESGGFLTMTGNGVTANVHSVLTNFGKGITLTCVGNFPRTTMSSHCLGFYISNVGGAQFKAFYQAWNVSGNIFVIEYNNGTNAGFVDTGIAANATQHTFKIEWLADGTGKYYIDGNLVYTGTQVNNNTDLRLEFGNIYDGGSQMKIDSVVISSIDVSGFLTLKSKMW